MIPELMVYSLKLKLIPSERQASLLFISFLPHSCACAWLGALKIALTIGDKNITYLIFIPDELFSVIPCVLCVQKRTSRGTNTELLDKITLPKFVSN